MKTLLLIFVLFFSTSALSAQGPLPVGQNQLNVGFGLSSYWVPLYIGLDFGVHPDISVGLEATFRPYDDIWRREFYRYLTVGFSGNGNYHFNRILYISPRWDLYAGLNVGFYLYDYPDGNPPSRTTGLGVGGQIGGRLYFTNNFGINLEFGGGNAFSGGKFGISVKL